MLFAVAIRTHFNPRSPHGERPVRTQVLDSKKTISTHAPRTGSDPIRFINSTDGIISTHAPRTGSDDATPSLTAPCSNFNPRSPHGERRRRRKRAGKAQKHFNPRSPHGERLSVKRRWLSAWHFNPRSPHGERRCPRLREKGKLWISTHAPRTGSDFLGMYTACAAYHFNPRSPHGERQRPATPPWG